MIHEKIPKNEGKQKKRENKQNINKHKWSEIKSTLER